MADLARAARLSPAHFSREFRRTFGETPHQYLLTRRLERAAALLPNTDRPVTEICFAVGLTSLGSFTTSFGRVYGTAPSAYRASFPPARRHIRVPDCVGRLAQAVGLETQRQPAEQADPQLGAPKGSLPFRWFSGSLGLASGLGCCLGSGPSGSRQGSLPGRGYWARRRQGLGE